MSEDILKKYLPSRIILPSRSTKGTPAQKVPRSVDVYDVVTRSMSEMAKVLQGTDLRHGCQEWLKQAKRLSKVKPSPLTFMTVGHTGSGKSTAMNAAFRNRLLASSSEVACTSVVTKVAYSESSDLVARVHFISRDTFQSELKLLLEDMLPSNDADDLNEEQTNKPPAIHSKTKLMEIYPHLRESSFSDITVEKLLDDPVVAPFLCNSQPHEIIAQDVAQLRKMLHPFLASKSPDSDEPAFWHLVHMVELFGDIAALSTGVTIVDLPGYGDANVTRNNLAEQYLKTADCVLLVADLKRAIDESDVRDYFTRILKQLLVDGRAVDDGSLMLLLTGTDYISGDGEVTLRGDDKVAVDKYTTFGLDLKKELTSLEEAYSQICELSKSVDEDPDIKEAIEKVTREVKIDAKKKQLEAIESSKNVIVARARSENVSAHFRCLYRDIYCKLTDNTEPPSLHIFCVGSRDFLALAGLESGRPLVFKDEKQTGIPDLVQRIRDIGEHHSLTDASLALSEAHNLLGLVLAHFKACTKKDDRLKKYEADAMSFQRALRDDMCELLTTATEDVNHELSKLEAELAAAIQKADDRSEYVFQSLVTLRWNVYSALMRRHGEWKETDLNENLTKDISDAIFPSWNTAMNKDIPAILGDLKLNICKRVQKGIEDICNRSKTCKTITDQILKASLSIGYKDIMRRAHTKCCRSVTATQRDGNRFRAILQNEMIPHYDKVGAEHGKGMFLRMKEENSKYILDNHELLFATINNHATSSFEGIRSSLNIEMTTALEKISLAIYTSLVSVQHATKLDHLVQGRMKKRALPQLVTLMTATEPSMQALSAAVDARLKEIVY